MCNLKSIIELHFSERWVHVRSSEAVSHGKSAFPPFYSVAQLIALVFVATRYIFWGFLFLGFVLCERWKRVLWVFARACEYLMWRNGACDLLPIQQNIIDRCVHLIFFFISREQEKHDFLTVTFSVFGTQHTVATQLRTECSQRQWREEEKKQIA